MVDIVKGLVYGVGMRTIYLEKDERLLLLWLWDMAVSAWKHTIGRTVEAETWALASLALLGDSRISTPHGVACGR